MLATVGHVTKITHGLENLLPPRWDILGKNMVAPECAVAARAEYGAVELSSSILMSRSCRTVFLVWGAKSSMLRRAGLHPEGTFPLSTRRVAPGRAAAVSAAHGALALSAASPRCMPARHWTHRVLQAGDAGVQQGSNGEAKGSRGVVGKL